MPVNQQEKISNPELGRLDIINENLFNQLPAGIVFAQYDETLKILWANPFFYSLFFKNPDNLKNLLTRESFHEFMKKAKLGSSFQLEVEVSASYQKSCCYLKCACCFLPDTVNILHGCCESDTHFQLCFVIEDITKYKKTETQYQIIKEEQKIVMKQTGRIIAKYEIATKTLFLPQMAVDIFGMPGVCKNAPYSLTDRYISEESRREFIRFYESMMKGKPYGNCYVRMKNITGNYAWYATKYTLTYTKDHKPFRGIITFEDVTDLQEKEIAYKKWQTNFESQRAECVAYYEFDLSKDLFESIICEGSEELPDEIRSSFTSVIAYTAEHFIISEYREGYLDFFSKNKLLAKYYTGQKEFRYEHRRIGRNQKKFWALAIVQLVPDPYTNDIKASLMIKNINQEKESYLKLKQLSTTDPLTGILNRATMIEKTNEIFQKSSLSDQHVFLMIDLDNFKKVNDTKGHQFGDRVLCDVAEVLKKEIRYTDLCARMGGDEFAILLINIPSMARLGNKLQHLCSSLSKTYEDGISVSGSIGVAIYPQDGNSFYSMYQKADTALYQAKRNGRNQFSFYEDDSVVPVQPYLEKQLD